MSRHFADGTPVEEPPGSAPRADERADGPPPAGPRPAPAPEQAAYVPRPVAGDPRRDYPPVERPIVPSPARPRRGVAAWRASASRRWSSRAARAGAGMDRMRDTSLILLQRARASWSASWPGRRPRGQRTPYSLPALYVYVRTAHALLVSGLLALALALALPWGTNRRGLPLYLSDFTSPRLAQAGVPVAGWAAETAGRLVLWAFGLSAAMILANIAATAMNVAAYQANMPGCLAVLLSPVIVLVGFLLLLDLALMAGFGLLAVLSQLPGLYDIGLSNQAVSGPAAGFWLWWVGIALGFAGAFGQIGMRRRVV